MTTFESHGHPQVHPLDRLIVTFFWVFPGLHSSTELSILEHISSVIMQGMLMATVRYASSYVNVASEQNPIVDVGLLRR